MKTAKLPKFDWDRLDDCNSGHTKDEWGIRHEICNEPKIKSMVCYTILWKETK